MPLPIGTWKMNLNGQEEDFIIRSAQDGSFNGTVSGRNIDGFWDEVSQTITFGFSEVRPAPTPPFTALFKGYLFRTPRTPAPGRDVMVTLTGCVQVSSSTDPLPGTTRRNVFGWFAQITEVN
jgi:hypothetical protein